MKIPILTLVVNFGRKGESYCVGGQLSARHQEII